MNASTIPASLLYFLFFVSGCAGLIYETLWLRVLVLEFGASAPATATVLSIFLGGLGFGAWGAGRLYRRIQRPLRSYAWVELSVGLLGLLSPFLLSRVSALSRRLPAGWTADPLAATAWQALFVLPVLLPPALLMGATLPLLTAHRVRTRHDTPGEVGRLYGWNTAGAVCGILANLYLILPVIGVKAGIISAALLNFAACGFALLLSRRELPQIHDASTQTPSQVSPVLLLIFALGGACSMALEVAWTRLLIPLTGSSVYAFGMMLCGFLAGLACGSLAGARFNRSFSHVRAFLLIEILLGLTALITLPLFSVLPTMTATLASWSGSSFALLQVQILLISVVFMFLPTFVSGLAFPALLAVLAPDPRFAAPVTGQLYVWNTLGGILGSLIAGFVLLPWLGPQQSVLLVASLPVLAGASFLMTARNTSARFSERLAVPILSLLLLISALAINRSFDPRLRQWTLDHLISFAPGVPLTRQATELLYQEDGINAAVSVERLKNWNVFLSVNGRTNASNTRADMQTQLLLAHLPMIYTSDPERVLLIGLGSGITLGALAGYHCPHLECAELEPRLQEAARFFQRENRSVLDNPDVRIYTADGRRHLLSSDKIYDLIISEPSHLWAAGTANLYSQDFFQLCRERLSPRGIFCQWFHVYQLHTNDLRLLLATFRSVFPDAVLWFSQPGDLMLIGGREAPILDGNHLRELWDKNPIFRSDLQMLDFSTAESILACFLLDPPRLSQISAGVEQRHTDDLPLLEFYAPRAILRRSFRSRNFYPLFRLGRQAKLPSHHLDPDQLAASPEQQFALARAWNGMKLHQAALVACQQGLRLDRRHPGLRLEAARTLLELEKAAEARSLLENWPDGETREVEYYNLLARSCRQLGLAEETHEALRKALQLNPGNADAVGAMGDLYFDAGDFAQALIHYRTSLELRGTDEAQLKKSESMTCAYLYGKSGYCLYRMGRFAEGRHALEEALAWDGTMDLARQTLGDLCLKTGDFPAAADAYRGVLARDRENDLARLGLWRSLKKLGHIREAEAMFDELMERRPFEPDLLRDLASQSGRRDGDGEDSSANGAPDDGVRSLLK